MGYKYAQINSESLSCETVDEGKSYVFTDINHNMIVVDYAAYCVMKSISELHKARCFQVGGSLLPHKTRDYDIIILNDERDAYTICRYWELNYKKHGFSLVEVYPGYNDEDDPTLRCVVKLEKDGVWYDLLYILTSAIHKNILQYMELEFPLSCQCIARDLEDDLIIGKVNVSAITVRHYFFEVVSKYAEYYPSATFTDRDGEPSFIPQRNIIYPQR